jgi:predicted  nucleic acid-binding Zn-ribbon protein
VKNKKQLKRLLKNLNGLKQAVSDDRDKLVALKDEIENYLPDLEQAIEHLEQAAAIISQQF